ncbi:SDR family NAD(P)-dependent oxidoreductase [Saccharopolyspora sp. NPDC000995]
MQELTDEDWHRTFAGNTTGVFNLSRAVSKHMIRRKRGAIVAVSSNAAGVPAGHVRLRRFQGRGDAVAKSLGLGLAEYGIRCNVVAPGSTDTEMQRGMWGDERVIAGAPEAFKAAGSPVQHRADHEDQQGLLAGVGRHPAAQARHPEDIAQRSRVPGRGAGRAHHDARPVRRRRRNHARLNHTPAANPERLP